MPDFPKAAVNRCHVAGAEVNGVQLCTRCLGVLGDSRGMETPDGRPLRAWADGAEVEIVKCGPMVSTWVVSATQPRQLPLCGELPA